MFNLATIEIESVQGKRVQVKAMRESLVKGAYVTAAGSVMSGEATREIAVESLKPFHAILLPTGTKATDIERAVNMTFDAALESMSDDKQEKGKGKAA